MVLDRHSGMRHFSVGLVDRAGVEKSSRTALTSRRAVNKELPSLRRRAEREARRSRGPLTVEITEHIGSCRGCRSGTGLGPGCRVVDEQRIGG